IVEVRCVPQALGAGDGPAGAEYVSAGPYRAHERRRQHGDEHDSPDADGQLQRRRQPSEPADAAVGSESSAMTAGNTAGMSARYQVAFYEPTGRLVYIHTLTAVDQLAYTRRLNGVGTFMMSLPRDLRQPVMLQKDALAQVYRSDPATGQMREDGTYFLRSAEHVPGTYDGLVIGGVSVEHLLKRRVYNPDDDP